MTESSATSFVSNTSFNSTDNATSSTEEIEATTEVPSYDATSLKIASVTFSIVASLFLSYVILALCYYGYKNKFFVRCGDKNWYKKNKEQTMVNSLIIVAALAIFGYVVVELPLLEPPSHTFCAFYFRTRTITYAISLLVIYFILWYRVYAAFYSHPILKQMMSKWLRLINILVLIYLILLVFGNLGAFLSAPAEVATKNGCKSIENKNFTFTKYIILVSCTTVFQLSLLISFIYPLNMHRKRMVGSGVDTKSNITIVKRSTIVAIVCIISDIVTYVFPVIYKSETIYMKHTVMACNLTINLMGVILSFSNWKEKLMPFKLSMIFSAMFKKQSLQTLTTSSSEMQITNISIPSNK